LLIEGDKILAVEQGGRVVSIRDLQSGALSHHVDKDKPGKDKLVESFPQHRLRDPRPAGGNRRRVPVWMRVADRRVYIMGPGSLMSYSLDRPADDHWNGWIDKAAQMSIRDAFLSHDYLVLLDEPGSRRRGEAPNGPALSPARLHPLEGDGGEG